MMAERRFATEQLRRLSSHIEDVQLLYTETIYIPGPRLRRREHKKPSESVTGQRDLGVGRGATQGYLLRVVFSAPLELS